MTLAAAPPTDVAPRTSSEAFIAIPEHLNCPNCDHDVTSICTAALARAQQQLKDLEGQVQVLNEKATAAGMLSSKATDRMEYILTEIFS